MKQIVIIADMEGASGIYDENYKEMVHGTEEWRKYGREKITSDVLAVCEAINESGNYRILIYDGHYAGNPENNIIFEKLPRNVRQFDTERRCFDWRRIRGQANIFVDGLIMVGQHARNGGGGYFEHTIEGRIESIIINEKYNVAEIGMGALNFKGTRFIANIGDASSMKEAEEITNTVEKIIVKDKEKNYHPTVEETFKLIKERVKNALSDIDKYNKIEIYEPCTFEVTLKSEYSFKEGKLFFNSNIQTQRVTFESSSVEIGFEFLNDVRKLIR